MIPRINPHKEYESLIHDYRIAAGLTHKELADQSKISASTICALANGTLAPIREDGSGQLRTVARRLCEFFDVSPADLFPRYLCSLNRSYAFEIQPHETWSERAADNCGAQLENRDLARVLVKIGMENATPRERRVFKDCIFNNTSFTEIADKECLSLPCIVADFKKSLRRITKAAQQIGLPIDHDRWMLSVRERLE
jgi:transcriptional regulator with XRE-family HTH domain